MIRKLMAALSALMIVGTFAPNAVPVPAEAAAQPTPKPYVTWAWCGVRPSDPSARAAAHSLATAAGIDATFGPCNVPTPDYTAAYTANRYVDPATYMQLVLINAEAGMKTIVYDARIWSDDAKVRDRAIRFWEPVYSHIEAWDMGDEFNAALPEFDILVHRWKVVLGDAALRSGILPYTNFNPPSVERALHDLPGIDRLISFDQYNGDLGAGEAKLIDGRVKTLMCAVGVYNFTDFETSPDRTRHDMTYLADAGCDQFLVFGGQRVYDTDVFRGSLVDEAGAPTSWAAGVLEGAGTSSFTPVPPARLMDTRPGLPTADGQSAGGGPRAEGTVTTLKVAGRANISPMADSAVFNVTATGAMASGFVTVYPCDVGRPNAAQLNYTTGIDVATTVVSKLSATGDLCLFNSTGTDLVVDVNGFFPAGASLQTIAPARLLETRSALATVDGAYNGVGIRGGGSVTELQVGGRGQVPPTASDVVIDLTATNAAAAGYVAAFDCDGPVPSTSNLNYGAGATATNVAIAPLRADGRLCLYTSATIDLIVDVNGYFSSRAALVALKPSRLLDSRPLDAVPPGSPTVDGLQSGIGPRHGGSVTEVQVAGRASIPPSAASVALNLTVTNPQHAGFVTVFPCGQTRPGTSNLNYELGATVANMVIARVGAGGRVCLYTSADTDVIVDATHVLP